MFSMRSSLPLVVLIAILLQACGDGGDNGVALQDNVLVLTEQKISNSALQKAIDGGEQDPARRLSGTISGKPVTIVKLRGKTNHFGRDRDLQYIDYHATVPDTRVWIAEYPYTRDLNLATDEAGVQLYIASPPDSLEGDNDSPPGEP